MNDIVVSTFNAATWESHGVSWARSLKSLSLSGAAVDYGIPESGKEKIKELGITLLPGANGACPPLAQFESILPLPSGTWLYCPPDYKLTTDIRGLFSLASEKMVCRTKEQQTFFMVFPIGTIEERVSYATLIEDKISKKHGNPLSAEVICGPSLHWMLFVGFFKYCVESGFLDARAVGLENLAINIFSVTFEGVSEVI